MLKKLDREEERALIEGVDRQYGSKLEICGLFLEKQEKRGARKIFLYTGERIPNVPAEWTGQHFCTVKEDIIIPSIEGAEALGRTAEKVIELSHEEDVYIMSGRDVELEEEKGRGYYILKTGDDVLGIGLVENRRIINQTPKSRRTMQQFRTI